MNIKCPNKSSKLWKELVEAVGENNAYYLWDLNNGYSLDMAPNGEPSKLFSDLLSHFNGDRNIALLEKARVYSEGFKMWSLNDNTEPTIEDYHAYIQSTATPEGNNTQYSLDEQDPETVFKNLVNLINYPVKVMHKYKNFYYLNKTKSPVVPREDLKFVYLSDEEIGNRKEHITRLANASGFDVSFFDSKNGATTRIFLTELRLTDALDRAGVRGDNKVLFEFLQARFRGLTITVVSPELARRDNVNAWIDGNHIYLVEGRYTDEITIEEALHPFINTLYNTNHDLFQSLYEEVLKKYPKLRAEINRRYVGVDDISKQQELVTQALSREFNEVRKHNKPSRLRELLNSFVEWFKALFTDEVISSYGVADELHYIDSTKLPVMTIRELANLINTSDTQFDILFDGTFYSLSEVEMRHVNNLYEKILRGLQSRLRSLQRYSRRNFRTENEIKRLLNQIANSEAEQGIILFIDHITHTIQEAALFLTKDISTISSKQIRLLSQDYVGFYKPLLDEIIFLLDTSDIFKDTLSGAEDGELSFEELKSTAIGLQLQMTTVYNRFLNVLKNKGLSVLLDYLRESGMPESMIDETIEWLRNPVNDTNTLMLWVGMASNSNNPLVQTVAKMLNDVMSKTQRLVLDKGIDLVTILRSAKLKYGADVLKILYERFDDGTYTGYRVTPINMGKYKKDLNAHIDKLAAKLGLTKNKYGVYELPHDENIQRLWYDGLNEFYSNRTNRRYNPEYYKLRNRMLSLKTRDAVDEYLNIIDAVLARTLIDGVEHSELLTQAEYRTLLLARRLKALLANPYNEDGSIKTGDDKLIADELTAFNKKVNENVTREEDVQRYNKDYKKIVKYYGSEDHPAVKLWVKRNTKVRYTLAFYDRLKALNPVELSETYEKLVERRRTLKLLYINPETNEVDLGMMPDSVRAEWLQLDKDISDARISAPEGSTSDRFNNFAVSEASEQYYKDEAAARRNGYYDQWFFENHYEDHTGTMRPATYYTTVRPKDELMSVYSETVPTGKYTRINSESNWFNPDFDTNGPSIQPKKEFYDNSKAYNEIMNKPELKALYDAIVSTMEESMSMIPFLMGVNDGRMPLMHARFAQIWARLSGIAAKLGHTLDEVMTTLPEDLDYVRDFEMMPNGDPIKVIPTRFIKMLDNPNFISTDAVTAVLAFYNMAVNFQNMSQQQDNIELILNLLRGLSIRNTKDGSIVQPGSSNLYKLAQFLVDRLMYGRNMTPTRVRFLGREINVSKLFSNILNFIRKVNLSGNLWSIATSFFTDSTYTTMEAKLGRFFDTEDLRFAVKEFSRRLPEMMTNVGNPVPNNKLAYLLALNQVVKSNLELFDRLDLSTALRAINQNFWYFGYTLGDYLVKSHTLISVYHNFRFVEGVGFMSKAEYINRFYPEDKKRGGVEFNQLPVTLYDVYIELPDGSTTVDERYKLYLTDNLLNKVKNRIDVIARRIDGTIREVDKTRLHAHFVGQYITLHKNFMIQGLHDRFKKRQFNLDLGVTESGYYRVFGKFLLSIIGNKHFALKQLLADYNQLDEYELYGIRRVTYDMMLITASTLLALSFASFIDGDDEYDTWVTLAVAYIALRSAFEFRTLYNPMEFIALIKSPTAAWNVFDNAQSFINVFLPFSYIGENGPFSIIDRGVYKGFPRIVRNIVKVTPIRSIIEAQDPKAKRTYLQNQLMSF